MNKATGFLGRIITFYLYSVMFASLLMSGAYIKGNGFGDWLLGGEIKTITKSFIWPYYLFSGNKQAQPEYKADQTAFINTIMSYH